MSQAVARRRGAWSSGALRARRKTLKTPSGRSGKNSCTSTVRDAVSGAERRVRVVMRYTHLGHGYCLERPDKYSPSEALLDSILNWINENVYRYGEEDEDKVLDEIERVLRDKGFKAWRLGEEVLVEETGGRYYCIEVSPRDTDYPCFHPRLILVEGAPRELARRIAARLCCPRDVFEVDGERILYDAMEPPREAYDMLDKEDYDALLLAMQDGHMEVELECTTTECILRDIRPADKYAAAYWTGEPSWVWKEETEWRPGSEAEQRMRKALEKLRKAIEKSREKGTCRIRLT